MGMFVELWNWLPLLVQILLKIVVIVLPLMVLVAYYTYAERKVIGYMQARVGPNRVGFSQPRFATASRAGPPGETQCRPGWQTRIGTVAPLG